MLYKAVLLSAVLLVGPQSRFQPRDLERLLPPPAWIEAHAGDLGISSDELESLRGELQGTRREASAVRRELQAHRRALQETLSAEPLDRTLAEQRFTTLLEAENRMKQLQLRARLDFLASLTDEQRAAVRQSAAQLAGKRDEIRGRIEELRSLGRQLERAGRDTESLRAGVQELERMIRRGEVDAVLARSEALETEMRAKLDR